MADEAVIAEAYKKGAAWIVKGYAKRTTGWVKASFVGFAPDVEHMTREEFRAFALRKLPECTEDVRYSPLGEVLV